MKLESSQESATWLYCGPHECGSFISVAVMWRQ